MAELALKIGTTSGYADGDIIAAFDQRSIRSAHAHKICFRKVGDGPRRRWAGLDSNGLLPSADLAWDLEEGTRPYRLDRLSRLEARVIRLEDQAEIRFRSNELSVDFGGRTFRLNVPEYFAARRRSLVRPGGCGRPVFGEVGRECVFGGPADLSDTRLNSVWAAIESKSDFRESDHTLWPAGRQDLKEHLLIPVVDFSPAQRVALARSYHQRDASGNVIWERLNDHGERETTVGDGETRPAGRDWTRVELAKRQRFVQWNAPGVLTALGIVAQHVTDASVSVDCRMSSPLDLTVVEDKDG